MPLFLNNVTIAGNMTRDPEVREAGSSKVASFGLAINRKFKDKTGELKEDVTFVDCETWGRNAELVGEYLVKGRNVLIEGSLSLDTWEKDGQKRSKLKVTAFKVHFVGGNAGGNKEGHDSQRGERPSAPSEPVDGEPPF